MSRYPGPPSLSAPPSLTPPLYRSDDTVMRADVIGACTVHPFPLAPASSPPASE